MNTLVTTRTTRSIVPAFFQIDLDADGAEEIAAEACIHLNDELTKAAARSGQFPRFKLLLCEESQTTEFEVEEGDQTNVHSLAGMTIDSGSDRSATGLIRTILQTINDAPANSSLLTLGKVTQLATHWMIHRMALRPHTTQAPAKLSEEGLTSGQLLLHAFAHCAETNGGTLEWSRITAAFHQAKAEHPGQYEQLLTVYKDLNR